MKRREVEEFLREAGFTFVRAGKKHRIWQLGRTTIPVSHGPIGNWRNVQNFKREVARAVAGFKAEVRADAV